MRYDESSSPSELSDDPPDCGDTDLQPAEKAWCEGDAPNSVEIYNLTQAANEVFLRCDFLEPHWNRSKSNVKLYDRQQITYYGAGGAAPPHGDWMLFDRSAIHPIYIETSVAHELLHLSGMKHGNDRTSAAFIEFIYWERQCSGGNSALADW